MRLLRNKDVISGAVFAIAAIAFMIQSRTLTFGSPMEMGPAFFPRVVGGMLLVLAIAILAKGVTEELREPTEPLRLHVLPIFKVFVAVVVFVLALRPLGLILASALLVAIVGSAPKDRRWPEVAISAVVLSVLSGFLFVHALGLQAPLMPWR